MQLQHIFEPFDSQFDIFTPHNRLGNQIIDLNML